MDRTKTVRNWFAELLALSLMFFVVPERASAANEAPFPRLAGVNYGSPHSYDDVNYQKQLARLDVVLLNIWPGWQSGRVPMETVVRNIKAINPGTKVFLYINNGERNIAATDAWGEVINKLDSEGWWLYANGGSGTRVKSTFGTTHYIVNNTALGSRDASGDRYVDWFAKFVVRQFASPNPSIDGFFTDNVFWTPRVNGDWNRDGTTDSQSDPAIQRLFREGFVQHFNRLKGLMPGKYQLGNVADWGKKAADVTEFNGLLDGGLMEGIVGSSYSPEGMDYKGTVKSWGSWPEMMRWYRKTMAAIGGPRYAMFNQQGDPTDYQAFRYGFASCLLDDAYYAFTDVSKGYYGVNWFDEYDATLGQSMSGPVTTPWKSGVYRRDFENGVVLVNPRGNGAVTVDLGEDFRRINGTQAPQINDGQATRTVSLKDRDGIVLLRFNPQEMAKPKPPEGVVIQ
jgi:Hypothetical glycosyl hydrolase family 15